MTREEVRLCVAVDFLCDKCFEEFERRCAERFDIVDYSGHIGTVLVVELMEDEREEVYRQVLARVDECCWHK